VKLDIEVEHILHILYEMLLVINYNKHGDRMELGLYVTSLTWNCMKLFIRIK